MKQLLIGSNILLLAIILMMACNAEQNNDNKGLNRGNGGNAHKPCDICGDYSNQTPPGTVSADVVQKLTDAYKNDVSKSMIDHNGQGQSSQDDDALALVFSLEQMKNLIWHIDSAACAAAKKGICKDRNEFGIRFYYIKYTSEAMQSNNPEAQAVLSNLYEQNKDKHSLIMVPVYKLGKEWLDFDYSNFCGGINTNSKGKIPQTAAVIPIAGDNHGGLTPPPHGFKYPHVTP